jgi:uncharacterized protein YbjT (DUF2867 family)
VHVFIIGISGAIGGLVAERLRVRGDQVSGLVRSRQQERRLSDAGIRAHVGDVSTLTADDLIPLLDGVDVIVFTAGSNGGARAVIDAIDSTAVEMSLVAAESAGLRRFVLVSVFPEAWRERTLSDDEEHYFAVKKAVDVRVSRSSLEWLVLRPSLLTDEAGSGGVTLGPAADHEEIPREDVADVLVELLHQPSVNRRILELTRGETPFAEAVRAQLAG